MVAGPGRAAPRSTWPTRTWSAPTSTPIWLAETRHVARVARSTDCSTSTDDDADARRCRESVHERPAATTVARRAPRRRAERVLATIRDELERRRLVRRRAGSTTSLDGAVLALRRSACDRWRDLYRARTRRSASRRTRSSIEPRGRRRQEAMARSVCATRPRRSSSSCAATTGQRASSRDFYSYRYFASEGFLPGYSFPRLPLSAFIPARRGARRSDDEFLQRPRFLAITRVRAPQPHLPRGRPLPDQPGHPAGRADARTNRSDAAGEAVRELAATSTPSRTTDPGLDLCEHCGAPLPAPSHDLFRLQNVSTRRRDRISSDEEERRAGLRAPHRRPLRRRDGEPPPRRARRGRRRRQLAKLTYGDAATLWRINVGWRAARTRTSSGFVLDIERGYWARNEQADDADGPDDPIEPAAAAGHPVRRGPPQRLCSSSRSSHLDADGDGRRSQAALKHAIQVEFQLEDNELAAEPLPSPRRPPADAALRGRRGRRRRAAPLVDDPDALRRVAREALELCHFDPDTRRRPRPCARRARGAARPPATTAC